MIRECHHFEAFCITFLWEIMLTPFCSSYICVPPHFCKILHLISSIFHHVLDPPTENMVKYPTPGAVNIKQWILWTHNSHLDKIKISNQKVKKKKDFIKFQEKLNAGCGEKKLPSQAWGKKIFLYELARKIIYALKPLFHPSPQIS